MTSGWLTPPPRDVGCCGADAVLDVELLLDNPLGGVAIRKVKLKLHRRNHDESLRSLEVLNPTPRSGDYSIFAYAGGDTNNLTGCSRSRCP